MGAVFALVRDPALGLAPLRCPLRESPQFFNDRANPSRPVLNASFEHSPHRTAPQCERSTRAEPREAVWVPAGADAMQVGPGPKSEPHWR